MQSGPSKVGELDKLLLLKDIARVRSLDRRAVAAILPDVLLELDRHEETQSHC